MKKNLKWFAVVSLISLIGWGCTYIYNNERGKIDTAIINNKDSIGVLDMKIEEKAVNQLTALKSVYELIQEIRDEDKEWKKADNEWKAKQTKSQKALLNNNQKAWEELKRQNELDKLTTDEF